jgi:uncharacterized zinc-type alcohol dehydrogenase-like protein
MTDITFALQPVEENHEAAGEDATFSSAPMLKAVGFAAKHYFSNLNRLEFERARAEPDEVELEVLFCGVCHSDVHEVKNEWSNPVYPYLPGHEIVGRVTRAGS